MNHNPNRKTDDQGIGAGEEVSREARRFKDKVKIKCYCWRMCVFEFPFNFKTRISLKLIFCRVVNFQLFKTLAF